MTSINPQAGTYEPPIATWGLMALGLVLTLLMLLVGTGGHPASPWLLAVPAVLGLAGAWLAARRERPWWMIASALWGIALVPATLVVLTLLEGP